MKIKMSTVVRCTMPMLIVCVMVFAADVTVYVTKTGKKYHRASCSSVRSSKIAISLKKAAEKYEPCKKCDPPTVNIGKDDQKQKREKKEKPKQQPGSERCQATTKQGTQCKRNADPESKYCWQHKPSS